MHAQTARIDSVFYIIHVHTDYWHMYVACKMLIKLINQNSIDHNEYQIWTLKLKLKNETLNGSQMKQINVHSNIWIIISEWR